MDDLSFMVGMVFTSVTGKVGGDEIVFSNDDMVVTFNHYQDCCEEVSVEDITGDLNDLIGYLSCEQNHLVLTPISKEKLSMNKMNGLSISSLLARVMSTFGGSGPVMDTTRRMSTSSSNI